MTSKDRIVCCEVDRFVGFSWGTSPMASRTLQPITYCDYLAMEASVHVLVQSNIHF